MPLIVKWPGVIEAGSKVNEIISHELDADPHGSGGEPNIVEQLKEGHTANGKDWRVHSRRLQLHALLQG